MTLKEKIFAVLVLPVVLILVVVEPIAIECYNAYKNMNIIAGIQHNYQRIKKVYTEDLWQ